MAAQSIRLLTALALTVFWMPSLLGAQPAGPGSNPPLPPVGGTPVDSFRELLAAKPAEREQILAGKTVQQRKVLENSLRAYETLPAGEREERLRALELRFRLNSLLRLAPSNRAERLQLMPEKDRPLLADRLRVFDQLSPEDQKILLENERMIRLMTGAVAAAPRGDAPLTGAISNRLHELEVQLMQWQTLSPEGRVRVQNNFDQVFRLPPRLSPQEQAKVKESIEKLKRLAPAQREQCFRNFNRFANLSPAERRQFLIDVQEWSRLKPEEREVWHKLVSHMPPLPPRNTAPPLPRVSRPPVSSLETNG